MSNATETNITDEFTLYGHGLCYVSVCTSLSVPEATKRLNQEAPTGIESAWALSEDKTFSGGEPNSCICPDHPETHKHYLFNC